MQPVWHISGKPFSDVSLQFGCQGGTRRNQNTLGGFEHGRHGCHSCMALRCSTVPFLNSHSLTLTFLLISGILSQWCLISETLSRVIPMVLAGLRPFERRSMSSSGNQAAKCYLIRAFGNLCFVRWCMRLCSSIFSLPTWFCCCSADSRKSSTLLMLRSLWRPRSNYLVSSASSKLFRS